MSIKVGPYDVVESGSIIGFAKHHIEIVIGPENDRLTLQFIFLPKSDDQEKNRTDFKVIDDKTASLTFYGFTTSPLGFGSTQALHIGTLTNRKLYLSYRIYTLGELPERLIHYTFYVGEEVKND